MLLIEPPAIEQARERVQQALVACAGQVGAQSFDFSTARGNLLLERLRGALHVDGAGERPIEQGCQLCRIVCLQRRRQPVDLFAERTRPLSGGSGVFGHTRHDALQFGADLLNCLVVGLRDEVVI